MAKNQIWTQITKGLNSLFAQWTGAALTNGEMQAHDLNVQEQQRRERWTEDMYNKYESLPAQVDQMKAAGINPAMAVGGVQAPSMGSASASSPAPNPSSMDTVSTIAGLLQTIRGIKESKKDSARQDARLQLDRDYNEARIRALNADSEGKEFQNSKAEDLFALDKRERETRIDQMLTNIDNTEADTALKKANTTLTEFKSEYQSLMNSLAEIDVRFRERILKASIATADAQRLLIQSERELNQLRKEYAQEDRESEKKILKARLDIAESEADYMLKRKEKNQELLDAEVKAAKGNATHAKWSTGLDVAGKVATGIGALGAVGIGAAKLLGKGVTRAVTPLATDLWWDSHDPAAMTSGSIGIL